MSRRRRDYKAKQTCPESLDLTRGKYARRKPSRLNRDGSLSIVLVLVIVLTMSACDVPFYSQYQVKKYLQKAEPDFTATIQKIKEMQNAIFEDELTAEKSKKIIDEGAEKISQYAENQKNIKVPEQAQDLHSNLTDFYKDLIDITEELSIMIDFTYLAEKTTDDFIETSGQSLQSNNKLIKELNNNQTDYQKELEELQNSQVPEYSEQAKVALISVIEAYIDFLTGTINALKTGDIQYNDVDQFNTQMDRGIFSFTNQLGVIERRGNFQDRILKLIEASNDISAEIDSLKSLYKI